MSDIKEDRRVTRTKRDLKEAFFSLLKEKKDVKKISIIEITNRANYNRSTFYVHYQAKEELIDEIVNEAITGFLRTFEKQFTGVTSFNPKVLSSNAVKIFKYIEEHSQMFGLLFRSNSFLYFELQFRSALETIYDDLFLYEEDYFKDINKGLYIRGHVSLLIGLISYWIEHDFSFSADYMADQLLKTVNIIPSDVKISRGNK
ncbi:TetR/AcrR family transcriptional regulator [Paenibacillus barcinonensis]|uniref:TetR family transcriptional regulator n=1 Tax=Paenibacillus barcinonensis TaxID=198119 RepID=A0A2V4UT47_PAEBA|nr:TetR/AcrR family transcriptional regulator [Paenibacillus barcinonensis]PYE43263.1 TetR family transcriptional regulator [Paenibacillus barcinonensis]QKS55603.1 TetR/AcrR family transcriptional regulator [Paenibacillus barcinonensis]